MQYNKRNINIEWFINYLVKFSIADQQYNNSIVFEIKIIYLFRTRDFWIESTFRLDSARPGSCYGIYEIV